MREKVAPVYYLFRYGAVNIFICLSLVKQIGANEQLHGHEKSNRQTSWTKLKLKKRTCAKSK